MLGSSSRRGAGWVSPRPGSAAASLCGRECGDSRRFSRDAHGRRVHLAVCDFVGSWIGHLPTSVTPGRVPGSPAERGCGRDAGRLPQMHMSTCVDAQMRAGLLAQRRESLVLRLTVAGGWQRSCTERSESAVFGK